MSRMKNSRRQSSRLPIWQFQIFRIFPIHKFVQCSEIVTHGIQLRAPLPAYTSTKSIFRFVPFSDHRLAPNQCVSFTCTFISKVLTTSPVSESCNFCFDGSVRKNARDLRTNETDSSSEKRELLKDDYIIIIIIEIDNYESLPFDGGFGCQSTVDREILLRH